MNRYDELQEADSLIIDLLPANVTGRIMLAETIAREIPEGGHVLEFGAGQGQQTAYLNAQLKGGTLTLVDPYHGIGWTAEEARGASRFREGAPLEIDHAEQGILEYLQGTAQNFDAIVSAWTMHNFDWGYKQAVLQEGFARLKPGGLFAMMDKIYPDSKSEQDRLMHVQANRYIRGLPENIAAKILDHELEDLDERRIMTTNTTTIALDRTGFTDITYVDRIERDLVVIAYKPEAEDRAA